VWRAIFFSQKLEYRSGRAMWSGGEPWRAGGGRSDLIPDRVIMQQDNSFLISLLDGIDVDFICAYQNPHLEPEGAIKLILTVVLDLLMPS
jgi:hypothetical protein